MEDWQKSPLLNHISQEKLNLLMHIFEKSKTMSSKELIPYFLSASAKATSEGITFTDEETDLILSVLKERMSPEEIKKINTIKRLSKMLASRQSAKQNSRQKKR